MQSAVLVMIDSVCLSGLEWAGRPTPPCGQLTRCFSAVAELLVIFLTSCVSLQVVTTQYVDADRALMGMGDYSLRPEYAKHRVTAAEWRSMTGAADEGTGTLLPSSCQRESRDVVGRHADGEQCPEPRPQTTSKKATGCRQDDYC